jgi:hypothetical protein
MELGEANKRLEKVIGDLKKKNLIEERKRKWTRK